MFLHRDTVSTVDCTLSTPAMTERETCSHEYFMHITYATDTLEDCPIDATKSCIYIQINFVHKITLNVCCSMYAVPGSESAQSSKSSLWLPVFCSYPPLSPPVCLANAVFYFHMQTSHLQVYSWTLQEGPWQPVIGISSPNQ